MGDKGCTPSIEYLPDYSQEYIIQPHYWLGTLTFKPTLDKGWNLTAYDSTVDTKIPETINALAGLMEKAGKIAAEAAPIGGESSNTFGPGLYRLTFDPKLGLLTSVDPIFQMRDSKGNVIACAPAAVPKPKSKR
jgi:hypothetical protein